MTPDYPHKEQNLPFDHIDYTPTDMADYNSFEECDYGNDNFVDNLNF